MRKVEEKKVIPCIIFSNNTSFAYKLRLKLDTLGLTAEYKYKFSQLLDFVIENQEGIVFVSTKSKRCQEYLEKYATCQAGRNLSFVFLKDDVDVGVKTDNQFSFITSYDSLQDILPTILNKSNTRKYLTPTISPEEIDKYLSIILKSFRVSAQHLGYHYIKECVQLLTSDKNGEYTAIKDVYKIIASKYNKLTASIEKSIRVCINKSYQKANVVYDTVFSSEKLSNLSFINFLVEKTKQMNSTVSTNN